MNHLALVLYLLIAGALLADTATAGETRPDLLEWKFEVRLDDRPIGHHEFRVERNGDVQRIESKADFDVKILFFNAYRYRHSNVEVWRDGCLERIEASTDANGKPYEVRGTADGKSFVVETNGGAERLPACVHTFAYWHADLLDQTRLLNAQNGNYEQVDLKAAGNDVIRVGSVDITAKRYDLIVKDNPIALWYAESDGRWLALETTAAGGRKLRYEPVGLPAVSPAPLALAARKK